MLKVRLLREDRLRAVHLWPQRERRSSNGIPINEDRFWSGPRRRPIEVQLIYPGP
jgi:hypothetical protein